MLHRRGNRVGARFDDEPGLLVFDQPGRLTRVRRGDDGFPGEHRLHGHVAEVFPQRHEGNGERAGKEIVEIVSRNLPQKTDAPVSGCLATEEGVGLSGAGDQERNVGRK